MTHTTNTDELDEILQMAFMGLWQRNPDDDSFAEIVDKHGVLASSLKQEIMEWSNRRTRKIVDEVIGDGYPVSAVTPGNSALTNTLEMQGMEKLRAHQRQTAERLLQEGSK